MKKLTTEDFINKSNLIHNNKYNYNDIVYINNSTKIEIYCNQCNNKFQQLPCNHLKGFNCPICANNNKRLSQEEFIKRSILIHKNKYNYDRVIYINARTKVEILCNKCDNIFLQTPEIHLNNSGCTTCANNNKKLTLKEFIKRSTSIHNNKYSYDEVDYINNSTEVKIYCKNCKIYFFQVAGEHLRKHGCSMCSFSFGCINDKLFIKNPELKIINSVLYLKKFINIITNETFYKIGITTKNKRYFNKQYKVINISNIELPLYESYLKEKHLLNKFKNLQYKPEIDFSGHSECFIEDIINQEEIINVFNL